MRVSGPGQPAELLLDVAGCISGLQVPFAVIGAFAVSFYGIPRSTTDADAIIWLLGSGKTAKDILDVLIASGFSCEHQTGDFYDPIRDCLRIHDIHGNRMDILLGIRGMEQASVNRRVEGRLFDAPIPIIGVEDLIGMKLSAGSSKDVDDVRGILQISSQILDMELLRHVTEGFGRSVLAKLEELLR